MNICKILLFKKKKKKTKNNANLPYNVTANETDIAQNTTFAFKL